MYLGIDVSTQGTKVIVLEESRDESGSSRLRVVYEVALSFDEDLPQYLTTGGVCKSAGGVVTAPAAMWMEGVDLILHRLKLKVYFSSLEAASLF